MNIMDYDLYALAKQGEFVRLKDILSAVSEEDELVKKDALNTLDEAKGWSPLHYAIEEGHLEIVQLLLQQGSDPNLKVRSGASCLIFAIENILPRPYTLGGSLVEGLLDCGADPTQCTSAKEIPLNTAIRVGNFQAVYCLLNHFCVREAEDNEIILKDEQISLQNIYGETPLYKLLNYLKMPPSSCAYDYWYDKKRCLYAILLGGVDVNGMLRNLHFNAEERDVLHAFVTEAEEFIAQATKEFGLFGEDVVHQYIFSSEQEQKAFAQESFQFKGKIYRHNKDNADHCGKDWPVELSTLVFKDLLNSSSGFFKPRFKPTSHHITLMKRQI